MIKDYYVRVAAFLSGFITLPDGSPVPPNVEKIEEIMAALISSGYCTKAALKQRAIRDCDLILREELFPDAVRTKSRPQPTVRRCRFCGGRLSEIRIHSGVRYRHCFSCHFEWRCEDD